MPSAEEVAVVNKLPGVGGWSKLLGRFWQGYSGDTILVMAVFAQF